jgi:hypothetical protein
MHRSTHCPPLVVAAPSMQTYKRAEHGSGKELSKEGRRMTSHNDAPVVPDRPCARPPRRFSEGIERRPLAPSSWRVGRYSDGVARSRPTGSARRIGSFADGRVQLPDAAMARRVGSFGDGFERGREERGNVPRFDAQRSNAERRIAA